MEPTTGIEPVNLFLTKEALYRLSYVGNSCRLLYLLFIMMLEILLGYADSIWSGRRDSNSRHPAWKAEALPTELLPPVQFFTVTLNRIIDNDKLPQKAQ
jgi:hypothetical protein